MAVVAPDEASGLLSRLPADVCVKLVGSTMPADYRQQWDRWGRASAQWKQAYLTTRMNRTYAMSASIAVWSNLARTQEIVRALSPDIIVSDKLLFAGAYATVAKELGVPLILGTAYGSLYPYRRGAQLPRELRPTLSWRYAAALTRLSERIAGKARVLMGSSAELDYRAGLARLQRDWKRGGQALSTMSADNRLLQISAGIGAIERLREDAHVLPVDKAMHLLGPLPSFQWQQTGCECTSWIRSQDRPVALIGFGTMVENFRASLDLILAEAKRRGFRCALLSPRIPELRTEVSSSDFRVFPWVDQAQVLREPNVRLFFTHAGSGAIQDALWAAVPVVCSPVGTDGPYNAWFAESYGMGVWLRNHSDVAGSIARGFSQLSSMAQRASELRDLAQSLRGADKLVTLASAVMVR